ncbi:MAG: Gfo/Idh/MocA family protein [Armatimonadota bacterium]
MDKLNIGLIGAGGISLYSHMPSFSKNPYVEVSAVADPNLDAANRIAENFGVDKVTDDYHAILSDSSIDTVDICVPHNLHYRLVMDALNAGKDVILEKPISMNLEEADEMIATADKVGKRLLVSLNQRFLPIHRKVKEMLDDGSIGKPFLANLIILGNVVGDLNNPSNWRGKWDESGGGALFDSGTHVIDIMRYWFGEPTAVTAVLKNLLCTQKDKADDNASVIFEYDDNLIVNIGVSFTIENEPWSEKKFVYGTGGNVTLINEAAVPMFYLKANAPELIDVEHNANWHSWSVDKALTHFVDVLRGEAEPFVTAQEARETLRMILGAYQASKEGRRIIL